MESLDKNNVITLAEIAERSGVSPSEILSHASLYLLANAEAALGKPSYSEDQKAEISSGVGFILAMTRRINAILPKLDPDTALELLDANTDGMIGASILAQYCPLPSNVIGIAKADHMNGAKRTKRAERKARIKSILDNASKKPSVRQAQSKYQTLYKDDPISRSATATLIKEIISEDK
jgi:hypothetical protein